MKISKIFIFTSFVFLFSFFITDISLVSAGEVLGDVTVTVKTTPTCLVTNNPTYTGSPIAVVLSTSTPGSITNVKYDSSSTVPLGSNTYAITTDFTPTDTTNYSSLAGASCGNYTINKADQNTLNFSGQTVTTPTAFAALSTTGGSGTGTVTYAVTTAGAGCSISGTTLSYTATGSCKVTATKAADANYNVKSSAQATFMINSPAIVIPTVTTQAATAVTATTATLNGNITATGGANATVRGFKWGTTSAYGNTTTENGSFGTGAFTAGLTGLTCGATYHYQGYATNSAGTGVTPADTTFTTSKCDQNTLNFSGQTVTTPTAFAALSTTGGSGTGAVTYTVTTAGAGCSISGTTLSYTATGSCGVTATKAADANYNVKSSAQATFTINSPASYTYSFNSNGGSPTYSSVSGIVGSTVNSPGAPTRSGYSFNGWSPSLPTTMPVGGGSSTAQWSAVPTFTLTYTANTGGTISGTNPQSGIISGGNGTPVTAVPNDNSYKFSSWSDGVNTATRTDTNVTASKTVTASFTHMTGTLTPASPTCTISAGNSSCTVNLSWTVSNAIGSPTQITASGMTNYTSPLVSSGGPTSFTVPYSTRTFYLYNNAYPLAQTTATSSCDAGSAWNGSVCITAPTVTTSPVTSITQNSATSGGTISSNGGSTVTLSGIVWSTSINPVYNALAPGPGSFSGNTGQTTNGWALGGPWSSSATGLSCGNITYHVRAYATNSVGTSYGSDIPFTTPVCNTVPVLNNPTKSLVTKTSATLGATVTSLGIPASISERGIVYGITSGPTGNKTIAVGTTIGAYNINIPSLLCGTTYYYRGYAINTSGTGYSNEDSFTSIACNQPPDAPTISVVENPIYAGNLNFNVKGSDPDNDQIRYVIDWGDGSALYNTSYIDPVVSADTTITTPHPYIPGTYNVKALTQDINGADSVWTTLNLIVIVRPPVPTVTFTSNKPPFNQINSGEQIILSWTSKDAKSCEMKSNFIPLVNIISSLAPNTTNGSIPLNPLKTTKYYLTCTGDGGTSDPAQLTVTVGKLNTEITEF